jgi:hypothetical protein
MECVDDSLCDSPLAGHGLLAPLHLHHAVLDDLALIEFGLDILPIDDAALFSVDDGIYTHFLP